MHRRALLSALPPALAGCSALPAGPSTDAYPSTQPNVFATFEWFPERSTLLVEFARGNRLTADNTGLLAVWTDADARTVWVARDDADASGDPASTFPLSPGGRVRHDLPTPALTRLVWVAPGGDRSRVVAQWDPEEGRHAAATTESDA